MSLLWRTAAYYHVANPEDRESIAEQGLLPRHPSGHSYAEEVGNEPGVYLYRNHPGHNTDFRTPREDVWEVDEAGVGPTEHDTWVDPGESIRTKEPVAPQHLRLHTPGKPEEWD